MSHTDYTYMKIASERQFKYNWWGSDNGSGSKYFNKTYYDWLENYINAIDPQNICEIGCNIWTYMKDVDLESRCYIGYDIVQEIIDHNNAHFSNENVKFICKNVMSDFDSIPSCDLLIIKDVLNNWSNQEIKEILNLSLKKAKRVVICTWYDKDYDGSDIKYGEYRFLSSSVEPLKQFNPHVLMVICDIFNSNINKEIIVFYSDDTQPDYEDTKYDFTKLK